MRQNDKSEQRAHGSSPRAVYDRCSAAVVPWGPSASEPYADTRQAVWQAVIAMYRWAAQPTSGAAQQHARTYTTLEADACPGAHRTWLRCRVSSRTSCPGRSARSCGPAAPARAAGPPPGTPRCRRRRLQPAPRRPRRHHPSRLRRRGPAAHASLPAHHRPAEQQHRWRKSATLEDTA